MANQTTNQLANCCMAIAEATESKTFEDVISWANDYPAIIYVVRKACKDVQPASAIVFALLAQKSLLGKQTSIPELIIHFAKDITCLPVILTALQELDTRGLLWCPQKRADMPLDRTLELTYSIRANHLDQMTGQKKRRSLMKPDFQQFLVGVTNLTCQLKAKYISGHVFNQELKSLEAAHKRAPQMAFIRKHKLSPTEKWVFWFVYVKMVEENSISVDFDDILKEMDADTVQRSSFQKSWENGDTGLQKYSLLENNRETSKRWPFLRLTAKSQSWLQGKPVNIHHFKPVCCELSTHDTIISESLFYNTSEEQQIQNLHQALGESAYQDLCKKLLSKGLNPGLTILLYGHPGTGKTATISQWAKSTGRNILMVDIAAIKSPWVGESEKNLSRVFREYEDACNYYTQKPILLFNEADAIFGRRMEVQRNVDKMFNAMQNILLQEMENFTGIFAATTNLANHLDDAFDRRFLYKIQFQKPTAAVRLKILEKAFPDLAADWLRELDSTIQLTGGQVMNLRKKLTLRELIQGEIPTKETILQIAREEQGWLKAGTANTIGFNVAKATG